MYNIPECESGRIDELLDEIDGRAIIIPHKYKPPTQAKQKTLKERLTMLKILILNLVSKTDWKDDETILIYYMFYNQDNPVITNRWTKKMKNINIYYNK